MPMQYCRPKFGNPVIHYESDRQALSAFVAANGGGDVRFDADGTAHLTTIYKSEPRQIYVKPNGWLRSIVMGQFQAIPSREFNDKFELVNHP